MITDLSARSNSAPSTQNKTIYIFDTAMSCSGQKQLTVSVADPLSTLYWEATAERLLNGSVLKRIIRSSPPEQLETAPFDSEVYGKLLQIMRVF
jgi:hypothetical protein